jgi:hypothetical protein
MFPGKLLAPKFALGEYRRGVRNCGDELRAAVLRKKAEAFTKFMDTAVPAGCAKLNGF